MVALLPLDYTFCQPQVQQLVQQLENRTRFRSFPSGARFSHLLSLPEGEKIGKGINEAMKSVEADTKTPTTVSVNSTS